VFLAPGKKNDGRKRVFQLKFYLLAKYTGTVNPFCDFEPFIGLYVLPALMWVNEPNN
jgi:hypothetical protein